jgi:kynurenine 3-monooxygenase
MLTDNELDVNDDLKIILEKVKKATEAILEDDRIAELT